MEYQKVMNLLANTPNQQCNFKRKYRVEINDKSRGTHSKDNQISFKTSMLRQLYAMSYILVKGTIAVKITAVQGQANNTANEKVIFKNCDYLQTA